MTITTDLWSTKCSNQSFIGVTSHAYNPKARKRQSFKLGWYIELSLPPTSNDTFDLACELFEGSHTADAVASKIQEIVQRFLIQSKVRYIISDSAANMVRGSKNILELSLPFMAVYILGVKNLNDLRAKDLAKEEDDDDEDLVVNLSPGEEVAEAIKEANTVEAVLKELEIVYKNSLYTRIGCLSHKVLLL